MYYSGEVFRLSMETLPTFTDPLLNYIKRHFNDDFVSTRIISPTVSNYIRFAVYVTIRPLSFLYHSSLYHQCFIHLSYFVSHFLRSKCHMFGQKIHSVERKKIPLWYVMSTWPRYFTFIKIITLKKFTSRNLYMYTMQYY